MISAKPARMSGQLFSDSDLMLLRILQLNPTQAITPKIQPFAKCHATISRYGTIIALILLRNKIEKPVTAMDKVPSVTSIEQRVCEHIWTKDANKIDRRSSYAGKVLRKSTHRPEEDTQVKSIETIRKLTSRGMAVTVNAERKADSIFTFTYAFLETRVHICMS